MFSYEVFEDLCEKNKVTVYRVSCATGVQTSTLTSWKQGKYSPKVDKIAKIADFFDVPITEFLKKEE